MSQQSNNPNTGGQEGASDVPGVALTRTDSANSMTFIWRMVDMGTYVMSGKDGDKWVDARVMSGKDGDKWGPCEQIDALEDELRKTLGRFGDEFDVHPYTMAGLLHLLMIELVEPLTFESDMDEQL